MNILHFWQVRGLSKRSFCKGTFCKGFCFVKAHFHIQSISLVMCKFKWGWVSMGNGLFWLSYFSCSRNRSYFYSNPNSKKWNHSLHHFRSITIIGPNPQGVCINLISIEVSGVMSIYTSLGVGPLWVIDHSQEHIQLSLSKGVSHFQNCQSSS